MTERTYTQHDRELLLAAVLDITAEQFLDKMNDLMNDRSQAPEPHSGVDSHGGQYVSHIIMLAEGDPNGSPQILAQSLASMSDSTMHEFVILFGTDPLQ